MPASASRLCFQLRDREFRQDLPGFHLLARGVVLRSTDLVADVDFGTKLADIPWHPGEQQSLLIGLDGAGLFHNALEPPFPLRGHHADLDHFYGAAAADGPWGAAD